MYLQIQCPISFQVRKTTAQCLYEALLTFDDILPEEHVDEILNLLSDTQWWELEVMIEVHPKYLYKLPTHYSRTSLEIPHNLWALKVVSQDRGFLVTGSIEHCGLFCNSLEDFLGICGYWRQLISHSNGLSREVSPYEAKCKCNKEAE